MEAEKGRIRAMESLIKNSKILQAWLVLTLALCFGSSLAAVQLTLGPTIEENKINETREKVPELLLGPEGVQKMMEQKQELVTTPHMIGVEKAGKKTTYNVYEARYPNGDLAGWVAKAAGQGYADKIELLVGLDSSAQALTGIFVLDQKETPGLGNKIITNEWRSQFKGKGTARELVVVKGRAKAPHEIDSITGATISSKTVSDIVNATVNDLRSSLAAKATAGISKDN